MRVSKKQRLRSLFLRMMVGCILQPILFAGCAQAPPKPTPPLVVWEFPPQKVMESRDYSFFLEENQKVLENCSPEVDCDMALFNVAFVYAYPESPYYNHAEGLRRMEEVVEKYPQSVWAFQAKAMAAVLKTKIVAEQKKRTKLKVQLKSKERKIKRLKNEMERARAVKEEKIKNLKDQIERSRVIDVEMDQKERELLKKNTYGE